MTPTTIIHEGDSLFPQASESTPDTRDLLHSSFGAVLFRCYRVGSFRPWVLKLALRFEGDQFTSGTLRKILDHYHGVSAGAYSYGEGLIPGAFPAGVTIGRYVSMAAGVRVFLRNHPTDRLSLHPYFFNHHLGKVASDSISSGTLRIAHDAWIGERAIVTPGCTQIGLGAVVGAGAVVTKNVPDFAVVAGNPARLIRYRFPEETRRRITESRWWEKSAEELGRRMPQMHIAVGPDGPSF